MRAIILVLCLVLGCAGARVPTAKVPPANPTAARALRAEAHGAYEAKDFGRCAELFGQAAAAEPDGAGIDEYSQACCLALAGEADRAFASLDRSLKRGWRDADHLERDTDLEALRADARWRPVVARAQENAVAYYKDANPELRRIFEEDQGDRRPGPQGINWAEVAPRDEARRARVREILDAGEARVALDYFHAAMVFQHGSEVQDYQRAHELARKAAELDPSLKQARWLAAAAKDRELMNQGKPQLYGTQFRRVGERFELYQVDPSITDEERARWNVPPLAEAHKRAEEMNARK